MAPSSCGKLEERVGLGQLGAQRQQHALLAFGAVEVGLLHALAVGHLDVALAAAGVGQRGDAVVGPAAGLEDQPGVRLLVRQAAVELRVDEATVEAQLDPADRVDHPGEAGHVDEGVVVDVEAEVEADRSLDGAQAACLGIVGEVGAPRRRVERRLERELVDLVGVQPSGEQRLVGKRHVAGVARDADHHRGLGHRVDADDEHDVGEDGLAAGGRIGPEQENVDALGAVPLEFGLVDRLFRRLLVSPGRPARSSGGVRARRPASARCRTGATTTPIHACIATASTSSAPTTVIATRRSRPWMAAHGVSPAWAIAMPRQASTRPLAASTATRNSLAKQRVAQAADLAGRDAHEDADQEHDRKRQQQPEQRPPGIRLAHARE